MLLHETEGKAQGRVLITMISYECLFYITGLCPIALITNSTGKINISACVNGSDVRYYRYIDYRDIIVNIVIMI